LGCIDESRFSSVAPYCEPPKEKPAPNLPHVAQYWRTPALADIERWDGSDIRFAPSEVRFDFAEIRKDLDLPT
jgi:hypothetical protein